MKKRLADQWVASRGRQLSAPQQRLFAVMCDYADLLYNDRSLLNASEITALYALHALNHVLKCASFLENMSCPFMWSVNF